MLLKIKGRDHTIKDTGLPETRAANVQFSLRGENALLHILFQRGLGGQEGHRPCRPARRWGGALGSGLSHGDGAMSFTEGHGRRPWGAGTRQARLASAPGAADRRAPLRRETARRPSHLLNPEPRASYHSGVPQPQAQTPGGVGCAKAEDRSPPG